MSVIPGVTYTYNSETDAWEAYGRSSLENVPSFTPEEAGAIPLGTTNYSYPGDAIFVATNGSNSNNGTIGSPKATLAGAISAASSGDTIVIREGEYREYAGSISGKALTIQNYPGETVWFDGTDVETNWTSEGGRWWAPITVHFSHQVGHSQANPDTESRWVDSQNPVAHYTDMVFINGARLWQVQSNPSAGQFSVDYNTDRVWIAENPAGKEVRVAKRTRFLIVNGATTIRGIGWRRYATEMYELGSLYVGGNGAGSVIENCHMVDDATQPLSINGHNCTVTYNTIIRPGQTGIHANRADNCVVTNNVIREHNYEKFKTQPHAGGIKVTFTGNVTIDSNWFDGASNRASSVWLDASNWGGKITNNYTQGGFGGVFVESSGNIIVAGNRMVGNANTYHGLLLTISQEIQVWNNWANTANGYLFAVWQDDRQATYPGERFWDEGLRWHVVDNVFCNNVFGGSHALYQWYQRKNSDAPAGVVFNQMVSRFEGNYFAATAGQNPPTSATRLAGLEPGSGVVNYSTLSTFQNAHTIARNNRMTTVQNPSDSDMLGFTGSVALPAAVATAMGVAPTLRLIGPPRPAPVPRS